MSEAFMKATNTDKSFLASVLQFSQLFYIYKCYCCPFLSTCLRRVVSFLRRHHHLLLICIPLFKPGQLPPTLHSLSKAIFFLYHVLFGKLCFPHGTIVWKLPTVLLHSFRSPSSFMWKILFCSLITTFVTTTVFSLIFPTIPTTKVIPSIKKKSSCEMQKGKKYVLLFNCSYRPID